MQHIYKVWKTTVLPFVMNVICSPVSDEKRIPKAVPVVVRSRK